MNSEKECVQDNNTTKQAPGEGFNPFDAIEEDSSMSCSTCGKFPLDSGPTIETGASNFRGGMVDLDVAAVQAKGSRLVFPSKEETSHHEVGGGVEQNATIVITTKLTPEEGFNPFVVIEANAVMSDGMCAKSGREIGPNIETGNPFDSMVDSTSSVRDGKVELDVEVVQDKSSNVVIVSEQQTSHHKVEDMTNNDERVPAEMTNKIASGECFNPFAMIDDNTAMSDKACENSGVDIGPIIETDNPFDPTTEDSPNLRDGAVEFDVEAVQVKCSQSDLESETCGSDIPPTCGKGNPFDSKTDSTSRCRDCTVSLDVEAMRSHAVLASEEENSYHEIEGVDATHLAPGESVNPFSIIDDSTVVSDVLFQKTYPSIETGNPFDSTIDSTSSFRDGLVEPNVEGAGSKDSCLVLPALPSEEEASQTILGEESLFRVDHQDDIKVSQLDLCSGHAPDLESRFEESKINPFSIDENLSVLDCNHPELVENVALSAELSCFPIEDDTIDTSTASLNPFSDDIDSVEVGCTAIHDEHKRRHEYSRSIDEVKRLQDKLNELEVEVNAWRHMHRGEEHVWKDVVSSGVDFSFQEERAPTVDTSKVQKSLEESCPGNEMEGNWNPFHDEVALSAPINQGLENVLPKKQLAQFGFKIGSADEINPFGDSCEEGNPVSFESKPTYERIDDHLRYSETNEETSNLGLMAETKNPFSFDTSSKVGNTANENSFNRSVPSSQIRSNASMISRSFTRRTTGRCTERCSKTSLSFLLMMLRGSSIEDDARLGQTETTSRTISSTGKSGARHDVCEKTNPVKEDNIFDHGYNPFSEDMMQNVGEACLNVPIQARNRNPFSFVA